MHNERKAQYNQFPWVADLQLVSYRVKHMPAAGGPTTGMHPTAYTAAAAVSELVANVR